MGKNPFADMQNDLPFTPNDQPRCVVGPVPELSLQEVLRGRLTDVERMRQFIEAGNATVTLVSKRTGTRFTAKFARPDPEPGKPRPIWVHVLNGLRVGADYQYLGCIWPHRSTTEVVGSAKSRIGLDAPSAVAVRWFLAQLYGDGAAQHRLLAQMEVWHEGRCGRCGRKLTVPDSIRDGFGSECIQYVNGRMP